MTGNERTGWFGYTIRDIGGPNCNAPIQVKELYQYKQRLTVIMTLFWNITGDMNTQKMSYTNAQQSRTVATYHIRFISK